MLPHQHLPQDMKTSISKTMNPETKLILSHIADYLETGVIHDALIPYYDQHGKWIGTPGLWQQSKRWPCIDRIKSSHIPTPRRTYRDRSGTILRTSYIWRDNKDACLTHSGIQGSLIVQGNAMIHAPSLRNVGGNLMSTTNKRVYLPNLRTVGGHFQFMHTFDLHVTRLQHVGGSAKVLGCIPSSLATVGKSLGVYWCFEVKSTCLKSVGSYLVLTKAETLCLPELETVGDSFLATSRTQVIYAQKLQSIGGDFLADAAHDIRTPALLSVGRNMDTTSAKRYYDPRIKVGGTWTTYPDDVADWNRRDMARKAMKLKPIML